MLTTLMGDVQNIYVSVYNFRTVMELIDVLKYIHIIITIYFGIWEITISQ